MKLSFYQILGLTPNATSLDIRQAYLKLALMFHTDRLKLWLPPFLKKYESREYFQIISQVYPRLSDALSRKIYDANLLSKDPSAMIEIDDQIYKNMQLLKKYNDLKTKNNGTDLTEDDFWRSLAEKALAENRSLETTAPKPTSSGFPPSPPRPPSSASSQQSSPFWAAGNPSSNDQGQHSAAKDNFEKLSVFGQVSIIYLFVERNGKMIWEATKIICYDQWVANKFKTFIKGNVEGLSIHSEFGLGLSLYFKGKDNGPNKEHPGCGVMEYLRSYIHFNSANKIITEYDWVDPFWRKDNSFRQGNELWQQAKAIVDQLEKHRSNHTSQFRA